MNLFNLFNTILCDLLENNNKKQILNNYQRPNFRRPRNRFFVAGQIDFSCCFVWTRTWISIKHTGIYHPGNVVRWETDALEIPTPNEAYCQINAVFVWSVNKVVQGGENKWDGAESLMSRAKSDLHFITSWRVVDCDICMQKSFSTPTRSVHPVGDGVMTIIMV